MKILLDECITQAAAILIAQFLQTDDDVDEAEFWLDIVGRPGSKDYELGEFASNGGWFVITADRDKKKKSREKQIIDGPPLHKILPEKGVTAIYMTHGTLKDTTERVRAVISEWPEIKRFFTNSPPGGKALLKKQGKGFSVFRQ